jgi:kexin
MLKKFLIGLSLLMSQASWASDTYNPSTNQLTIKSVSVGGIFYNDVVITVGGVISIDGGTPKGSFDVYNPAANQLSIPTVIVNGITYTNVVISVGQVVSVGGSGAVDVITNSSSVLVTTFIAIN